MVFKVIVKTMYNKLNTYLHTVFHKVQRFLIYLTCKVLISCFFIYRLLSYNLIIQHKSKYIY